MTKDGATPSGRASNPKTSRRPRTGAPILERLDEIKPQSVRWLWRDRIPLGKITILAGEPGLGKSFVTLDFAARVSNGSRWPDDASSDSAPGGVVLFTAEDDAADTIVPRLKALGADLTRIHSCRGVAKGGYGDMRGFTLQDLKPLAEAIDATPSCRLVIVDPVSAYTAGGKSNEALRAMLTPVSVMAAEKGVAILLVTHFVKGGGRPLDRIMGSKGLTAVARAVWVVTKDPHDAGRRLMLPVKMNIAGDTDGLAFRIAGDPPRVEWSPEPVTITAEEAMKANPSSSQDSRIHEAIDWLRDLLSEGPVEVSEIQRLAKADGMAWRTIERAKIPLGVISKRTGFGGPWVWQLPEDRHGTPKAAKTAKSATGVRVTVNEPVLALLPGTATR